jgi:hypothetical protein
MEYGSLEERIILQQITCTCGDQMSLQLRTVIYSGTIEIVNVPIFTCQTCCRSIVYDAVKGDLTSLIEQIAKTDGTPVEIRFEERNELALLLKKASDKALLNESLRDIVEERINELLDIMLLAQSLKNDEWIEETRSRLRQITEHYMISR